MSETSRYGHYNREQLIALLERRDAQRSYGLVWEREGIEGDRAVNEDFVALELDPALSTAPQDAQGWRNLIIEGDNWDALRALRLAYAGRIKCILIDPPYNTGNKDFVYNDSFVGKQDRYRQSVWLEFLYRRLLLARDLLADDGVMLVCINDENRARLDLLMEQVFPGMRVGSLVWRTRNGSNANQKAYLSVDHEHILVYANEEFTFNGGEKSYKGYNNPDNDIRGPWQAVSMKLGFGFKDRPNLYYPLLNPETGIYYPCNPDEVWRFASSERIRPGQRLATQPVEQFIREKRILFPDSARYATWESMEKLLEAIDNNEVPGNNSGPFLRRGLPDLEFWIGKKVGFGTPRRKLFQNELKKDTQPLSSVRDAPITEAAREIKQIFGERNFQFSKPSTLIRELVRQSTGPSDIVLDFFAGSGTTGGAVLTLNAEDGIDRRFILVSNTEATPDEPSKNLCRDVCAERIRRALAGRGEEEALPGDFAYLRAKRLAWDDVLYDFDPSAVWTLLQLRHDRPLIAFNPAAPVQVSRPAADQSEDSILAYAPRPDDGAMGALRALAAEGALVVFTPVPGRVRDALAMPAVPIEAVPDRLLAEFPRIVAGL